MMCSNNERISSMTKTEIELLEFKRRLDILESKFRTVLDTNESLEKQMKILLKNMESEKK
jgi:hypothetical protein